MNLKMISKDHYTITTDSELFDISLDFNLPEQGIDPRWFVHRKDPIGWSMLTTFDPDSLQDALHFVNNFSKEA
jgi:hypothetical protein